MSHGLNNLIHHPNVSNLVELYEPIRHFGRAFRGVESQPFSDSQHFQRSHHHDSVLSPDFDLRETPDAYFLEGEFPGIQGRSAIKLQWMDGHTLRIQGTIQKTDLNIEWGVNITEKRAQEQEQDQPDSTQFRNDVNEQNGVDSGELVSVQGPERRGGGNSAYSLEKPAAMRLWLNERRAGLYVRNFSFPVAVNTDAIQARLSQGLLRIMVPKTDKSLFRSKEIHIETPEQE